MKKIGLCITGSFCTFSNLLKAVDKLINAGYDIIPVFSYNVSSLDTRFYKQADFEKLIVDDLVAIENEMAAVGEYALSPEISTSFLYRLAARAAGVGSDVISHLPIRDFGKIKNKSRDFLISTGF